MLSGGPGIGKTSAAHIIARSVLAAFVCLGLQCLSVCGSSCSVCALRCSCLCNLNMTVTAGSVVQGVSCEVMMSTSWMPPARSAAAAPLI